MGWRIRFPTIRTTWLRICHSIARFGREHKRELVIASVLAVLCAVAAAATVEFVRPWWLNRQRDEATRQILNATAILVSRDRNDQENAVGIGIFISPTGTLITNRHIVTSGGILARLPSGALYELKSSPGAIRIYSDYDFTILQFQGTGIPYVALGDSDTIRAREHILALIPQPTFVPTFADGFVSEPNRPVGPPINGLIEINAPVARSIPNGGLFGDDARVLGFISSLVVPADLSKDVSTLFAIPINRLKPLINGQEKQVRADSADSLYSQGILAENRKQFEEATRYFQQAIAVDPHYANAYFELGGIDYDNGDFDGQLSMYEKAAEYAPKDTDILFYLATAYEDKQLYDQAIAEYLQVLRLNSEYKDALYQLDILYMTRGDKTAAATYAARLEPLDAGLAAELRMILSRMR
jgi:tetratricopeptide (TPR) repeat protein